jgi:class 3 adenylate cyclase/CHASE2 domain-containing sensor protein
MDVLVAAMLAVAVCGIVFVCQRSVAFSDFEFWGYDFLVNHAGYAPASQHIVVVDFDEATFARLKQYPVPRRAFADVITRVAAGGARVIGLDVFLSEARSPGEDAALQKALANAGNVILASQAGAGGVPEVRPLPMFCEPEEPAEISGFCKEGTPESSGALGYALVNLPIESDGFVRRFFLFSSPPRPGVSFPVMLAQQYAGEALKPLNPDRASFLSRPVPFADRSDRTVWIGAWSPMIAKRIPAIDLLESDRDPPPQVRDKLVLIGQSHDAARDSMLSPLFRPAPVGSADDVPRPRLRLPAVEIHAAAIETLLTGRPVVAVPTVVTWTLLFLACAAAVLLVFRLDLGPASIAIAAMLIALYATAQAAFAWQHLWLRYTTLAFGLMLSVPAGLAYRFIQEKLLRSEITKEREQIMGLFGRYVSPEVAQQIWSRRDELVLAGEERVATVLFSDIRGFTAMTTGKPSRVVLQWLNAYLTAMDDVIRAHGGFLNKFIGDGIMVLFGVPLSEGVEKDATRAVRAALAMIERVDAMNATAGGHRDFGPIRIGIGLHTGKLTSGNVGSNSRLEYSAIGETVNLASRLETLTKEFHTSIVMSRATADAIRSEFPDVRDLGETAVRGLPDKMRLYAIEMQER